MILIPARNEAPRIARVIASTMAACPKMPVVVIVNGCTDDTEAVALKAGATVIQSEPGYGVALLAGYRYAMSVEGVHTVVQIDADGQHNPRDIPKLLDALSEYDVVIGSRFAEGGGSPGWALHRRWTISMMGIATSVLSGTPVRDISSGFQAFRRPVVESLCEHFSCEFTDANVLVRLHRLGFSIAEIGVKMSTRNGGKSMHGGVKSALYAGKTMLAVLSEIRG